MHAGGADSMRSRWLVGPVFDSICVAWAWVPFYVFVALVLGIDGEWSGEGTEPGLGLAILLALGISYVHRHYTFLLVYGDAPTFAARVRAYTLVPAALFVGLAAVLLLQGDARVQLFGNKLRPWMLVLIVTGAWNIWHTIMQRHGITRIYAGKAGGGLQTRAHARRDLALLWSAAALTAVLTAMFRGSTFAGIGNARRLLRVIDPLAHGAVGWTILVAVVSATLWVGARWLKFERAATLTLAQRIPRLNFMLSTAGLLAVFVVHGPVTGYLCFGVAHAIEYVFFFHVFGQRKFAGRPADELGLAGRALARPLLWGPVIAVVLAGVFVLLKDQRGSEPYLVYYTATSLLHFLYDGWIWKVRKPEVARPLGLA
jgi:hypothetical protein